MVTLQNPRELWTLWGFLSFTADQTEASYQLFFTV